MDTKKSNVNTGSQQKSKKSHSGLATAASMGVATVAGATIGRAFPSGDDQDPNEEVIVNATPEEVVEETPQEEVPAEEQQPVQEIKPAEEPAKETEPTRPEDEPKEDDDLEKNPDDVAEKIINKDEIDDPDYGNEVHAVEMRFITDIDGNEQEAMIFENEYGEEFALCQSDPESGIFDKWVNPYTLQEEDMPQEISYTRADFEELLHDDGGYIAPEPNGPMFADNDDISKDIKTTDNGEMLAQHEKPGQNVDVDTDDIDEPEIDTDDEEMIAQLLPDDDDDDDINEDLIDIIDDWLDGDDPDDELPEDVLDEEVEEEEDEESDEDELDEDELDEDETEE